MFARNEIQLSTTKHAYRPRPRAFNYLLGTVFADTSVEADTKAAGMGLDNADAYCALYSALHPDFDRAEFERFRPPSAQERLSAHRRVNDLRQNDLRQTY